MIAACPGNRQPAVGNCRLAAEHACLEFGRVFGHGPDLVVRAPGRVNLIGDHTDYTGGLVLPIAIDRALLVVAGFTGEGVEPASNRLKTGSTIEVHSTHFNQTVRVSLEGQTANPAEPWSSYVLGVIALLRRRGITPPGGQLWIGGTLPTGAGLASSAALEVGVALAMVARCGRAMPRSELATLCREAEHQFANSPCGIMDQHCCLFAREGHALLIDCRTEESLNIALNLGEYLIAVIDSGVRHSIAGAQYADRRRECASALEQIQRVDPAVRYLRDVPVERIEAMADDLGETLRRRARHVITENARVAHAAEALRSGRVGVLGRLMNESHISLRDDFAVSCKELDAIVAGALSVEGVIGARMTGGGFGGCAIALVHQDAFGALESAMQQASAKHADSPAARQLPTDGRQLPIGGVFSVRSAGAAKVVLDRDRSQSYESKVTRDE